MNTNEGEVYFALDGDDFDPDEVTEFLGIKPTSIRRKGSKVSGKIPKMNSWELSTGDIVNDYIDVFEMATKVVNKLKDRKDLILQAKERFNALPRFQVILWISMNEKHSTPAIGFEVETVKFLGEIGALVDIDTYRH